MTFQLRYILEHLRHERRRTAFLLFCIAVGVATVVALRMLGLMIGAALTGNLQSTQHADLLIQSPLVLQENISSFYNVNGDSNSGAATTSFSRAGQNQLLRWASQQGYEIQALWDNGGPFNRAYHPRDPGQVAYIMIRCVEAHRYPFYGQTLFVDPATGSLGALLSGQKAVVASTELANGLHLQVGDTLYISGASTAFPIHGIVSSQSEASLLNPFSSIYPFVYMDYDTCLAQFKIKVTSFAVRLPPRADVTAAKASLLARMPELRITTTQDLHRTLSDFAQTFTRLVTIVGLVSLLISGIGIANTMLVAINRRAMEIAVLKTIGLQAGQIVQIFLLEALLLGLAGSGIGILWGVGLALALKQVSETFVAQAISFQVQFEPLGLGLALGIGVTLAFALLPTLAAAQVRPLRLLHGRTVGLPPPGGRLSLITYLAVTGLFGGAAGLILSDLPTGMLLAYGVMIGLGLLSVVLRGLVLLACSLPTFGYTPLHLAQRAIRVQTGRAASTLLALVVGIFALSLIWMLVQGTFDLLQRSSQELLGGNVIINVQSLASAQALEGRLKRLPGVQNSLHDDIYPAEIVAINENRDMQALIDAAVQKAGTSYSPGEIENIAHNFKIKVHGPDTWKYTITQGRDLSPGHLDEIVLEGGWNSALLANYNLQPGDTLTFRFASGTHRTLRIVGQSQRPSVGFLLQGLVELRSAHGLVLPGSIPRHLDPLPSPYFLTVSPERANETMQVIDSLDGIFYVETRLFDQYTQRFSDQFVPLPVMMAGLALFASSVIMANSVALAMLERRRQVGIYKALGLQTEQVIGLLLLENSLIGLLGGLIGSGASSLVILSSQALGAGFANFPIQVAAGVVLLALVLSLLATFLSVYGPAQEKPLEVLRYE